MKTVRMMTSGFLLTGAIACVTVYAQAPAPKLGQSDFVPFAEPTLGGYAAVAQPAPNVPEFKWKGLNVESRQLAQKYVKSGDEEEKTAMRKKLHDVVAREYDEHVKIQQAELESLEKKIAQLRGVAKKRADAKSTIVNQRIDQLLQEAQGLGWGAPGSAGFVANPAQYVFYVGQPNAEDVSQLAAKYAKAEGEDEKRDIRKKLTETVGHQFDEHMKVQEKELEALEKQVASVKATMRKRSDAKSAIVERRIEQLLYEADSLGWAGAETNNMFRPFHPYPFYQEYADPMMGKQGKGNDSGSPSK